MELVPIGEAARRAGVRPSALRYYEERGLVHAAGRRGGRRVYRPDELRRVAFVQAMRRLGVSLDAAGAVLDRPSEQWRAAVAEQAAEMDTLISRARAARSFLEHLLNCARDHPVQECGYVAKTLDRLLAGDTLEQLAAEQGIPLPGDPEEKDRSQPSRRA